VVGVEHGEHLPVQANEVRHRKSSVAYDRTRHRRLTVEIEFSDPEAGVDCDGECDASGVDDQAVRALRYGEPGAQIEDLAEVDDQGWFPSVRQEALCLADAAAERMQAHRGSGVHGLDPIDVQAKQGVIDAEHQNPSGLRLCRQGWSWVRVLGH
jgi:hypothetical protein